MVKRIEVSKEIVNWLLESSNPSVRYRTLTELLDVSTKASQAKEVQEAVMESSTIMGILSRQMNNGGWDEGNNWYLPKYTATIWRLLLLSQLGVNQQDDRIGRACEYAFRFQLPSGSFAEEEGKDQDQSWGWAAGCLNGNVLRALGRLGYGCDPRVGKGLEFLLLIQEDDGGWLCRSWKAHAKDKHSCFMGSVCGLDALNALIPHQAKGKIKEAGARACEFLLRHKLFLADHHNWQIIKEGWTHLGFPYFTGYDVLRGLLSVLEFGIRDDERLGPALNLLTSKRTVRGAWVLERTYSNMGLSIGKRGKPSKWITLHALKALKMMDLLDGL